MNAAMSEACFDVSRSICTIPQFEATVLVKFSLNNVAMSAGAAGAVVPKAISVAESGDGTI